MIQIMTFLLAQVMFVPAYLRTTAVCIGHKWKFLNKIVFVLISPFAAYFYTNILFAVIAATLPKQISNMIVAGSDIIIITMSFLFVMLYTALCMKLENWNRIYYASIYLTFFLLQMAFNYTYATVEGAIICNIFIPLAVIFYYTHKMLPLYMEIKEKPFVKVSRFLFLLPALAEVFFIYRSWVVLYLSKRYPQISLNDIPANLILTVFAYILVAFIFICMTALLRNIQDEQDITIETEKNNVLATDMIKALVKTIDAKDPYTNGHSVRVAEYTKMLASRVYTDPLKLHKIYNIALLHDIGKIGIPDNIITKPGRLTDEEYKTIKEHTLMGEKILSEITSAPELIYGAKYHHERYDGKGYPCGLKGKEIPEIAAIIAVADTYDAMTSNRSYRNILPQDIVRNEIEKGLGTQFHPEWGKIMLELIDEDLEYKMCEVPTTKVTSMWRLIDQ